MAARAGSSGSGLGPGSIPFGAVVSSRPCPRWAPSQSSRIRAAVAGDTAISPAPASFSIRVTSVAPGPATISSRCDVPTRKRCTSPLCMPCDMRSGDLPGRGLERAERAQPAAQAEGRAGGALHVIVAVEEQQQRVAAELEEAAGVAVRLREQRAERAAEDVDELLRPWRPRRRASRSESCVKPEMSANSSVPSTTRAGSSGVSARCRSTMLGT